VTEQDRRIEESQNGASNVGLEAKSEEEPRRGRPASPPVRRSLFGEESLADARREACLRSTDFSSPTLMLTSPLDSAYGTERKTPSCCPVEPDANTPDGVNNYNDINVQLSQLTCEFLFLFFVVCYHI